MPAVLNRKSWLKFSFALCVPALAAMLFLCGGCTKESEAPTPKFTAKADDSLKNRIDAVVDYSRDNRTLNTSTHNAWQIVHGILPYGRSFKIEHEGQKISALDWLLKGGNLNGWDL